MGIGGVGIVLVLAAMAGPWWSLSYAGSALGFNLSGNADFGLFGGTTRSTSSLGSQTSSVAYSNATRVGSVFSTASAFAVIGMIAGGGMIAANAVGRSQPQKGRIGVALGLVAFLLTLLSAAYVMTSLPTAVNLDSGATGTSAFAVNGFWGSQTTTFLGASATVAWGAGWGWYAALIAAIVFLMGGVASLRGQRAAIGAAPGYPAYQQPP